MLFRHEASKRIWMKDSKGLIVKNRPEGGISEHKAPFAQEHDPMQGNLLRSIIDNKSRFLNEKSPEQKHVSISDTPCY